MSLKPLYLIYASLVTELFSTASCILTIAGYTSTNSWAARRIQQANVIAVPLVRIPAAIYGLTGLTGLSRTGQAAAIFFLGGYTWSFLRTKPRDFRRLGMLPQIGWVVSGRLALAKGLNLFGVFASAGYWAVVLSTIAIYMHSAGSHDRQAVANLLSQAGLAGYLGARVPSLLGKGGSIGLRTGYWFQAGILGVVLAIMFTPFSRLDMTDRVAVLSAVIMSVPMGEGVGRLGCHFAGCCGSSNSSPSKQGAGAGRADQRISAPLLMSALSWTNFAVILIAYAFAAVSVSQAAALAIILQGVSRIIMERFRSDIPRSLMGLAPTVVFAAIQSVTGILVLLNTNDHHTKPLMMTRVGFPISSKLSMLGILASRMQACSELGMEALGTILDLTSSLPFNSTGACSNTCMEIIRTFLALALPNVLFGTAQTCSTSTSGLKAPTSLLGSSSMAPKENGDTRSGRASPPGSIPGLSLDLVQSCSEVTVRVKEAELDHCSGPAHT